MAGADIDRAPSSPHQRDRRDEPRPPLARPLLRIIAGFERMDRSFRFSAFPFAATALSYLTTVPLLPVFPLAPFTFRRLTRFTLLVVQVDASGCH